MTAFSRRPHDAGGGAKEETMATTADVLWTHTDFIAWKHVCQCRKRLADYEDTRLIGQDGHAEQVRVLTLACDGLLAAIRSLVAGCEEIRHG